MIRFKIRNNKPEFACIAPIATYWNVYDGKNRVGWFGVFINDNKQYTDIEVLEKYRGQGYFKQVYDHFIQNYWNHKRLMAFVGQDNQASNRAHIKYGCKMIKHNGYTDIYLIKRGRNNANSSSQKKQSK